MADDADRQRFDVPPAAPGATEEAAMQPPSHEPGEAAGSGAGGVLRRHQDELMRAEGVVGVALGRSPIGEDAIVVYLRHPDAARALPTQVEGVTVETIVTGEIDALADSGGGAAFY